MMIANASDHEAARREVERPLIRSGLRAEPYSDSSTILPSLPPASKRS